MTLSRNQVIKIETSIENDLMNYEGEQPNETVEVTVLTQVSNPRKPHITYWEVKLQDDTGLYNEGDTVVFTERQLNQYKVLTGEVHRSYAVN